jgi:hypothetical protein
MPIIEPGPGWLAHLTADTAGTTKPKQFTGKYLFLQELTPTAADVFFIRAVPNRKKTCYD